MGTMIVARQNRLNKATNAFSAITRNLTCNRSYIRTVIQTTFATITVVSFILIVIMSIQNQSVVNTPNEISRCYINNCRVFCMDAPYFGKYEENIIDAITEVEDKCNNIYLSLNNPIFRNSTLPSNWLSVLRVHIHDLSIYRGNLMHIESGAFISPFTSNIRKLQFIGITIRTWVDESLVGLLKLEEISIIDCNIIRFQANALQAVDDTLQTLTITKSSYWNPKNVTGATQLKKLTLANFSFNYFNNILGPDSFTGLTNCKILYLNSCRITAISSGTFDILQNIEALFLNDNLLMTVPSGIFDNIILINPKLRLNLQGNLWYCDCSSMNLKSLVSHDVLILDPVCHNPLDVRGTTFSKFEHYCNNITEVPNKSSQSNHAVTFEDENQYIYINGTCYNTETDIRDLSYRLHSPLLQNNCFLNANKNLNIVLNDLHNKVIRTNSNWLNLNFLLEAENYSIIQIDSFVANDYGLLWFQSTCPNEVYCIDILPNFLRFYNIDINSRYTFCLVEKETGLVTIQNCIAYDISKFTILNPETLFISQIFLSIITGLICLIFGAICVYLIIRQYPWLLKGSKRILFVKHKMVDALVLPPKIPLRNDLLSEPTSDIGNKDIFLVSGNNLKSNILSPSKYSTHKSVRSNTSGTPSYISALQPTEEQLAEWRINKHFNNVSRISSNSEFSFSSCVHSTTGDTYYSVELENSKTYESL